MLKMYAPVEQDRSHTIPPSLPPPISTSYPPPAPMSTTAPIDHLSPVTTVHEGRIWSLHVVQQPIRARMCGFGDKDRRPITPPPCIRLIVRDAQTEDEIDIKLVLSPQPNKPFSTKPQACLENIANTFINTISLVG